MTLKGHFDGEHVVLDEPVPANIAPRTPVDVVFRACEQGPGHLLARIATLADHDDLPPDYSEQHEHYVKGTPRK